MDTTRKRCPVRNRNRVARLAGVALLASCSTITGDFDRIIAIEIVGPTTRQIVEGDTATIVANVRDAGGDLVPEAEVAWAVIDVDTGQVGFTIEPATGFITALFPGSGRVQVSVEEFRSGPVTIQVIAAPAP